MGFSGSILVASHGKVIFKKAYGLADKEWNVPNTIDTRFAIGSMTKQLTAGCIMLLQERGKLSVKGSKQPSSRLPENILSNTLN